MSNGNETSYTEEYTGIQGDANDYKVSPEMRKLIKKVEKLELTMHAMWIMLNKKGYTDEEFDQAMTESFELSKRNDYQLTGLRCPACGKNAQLSNFFKIKCIYCGSVAVMHPYEVYNMFPEGVPEEQTEAAPEAPANSTNTEFEPYDVTKDLNFDEL